jgi:hypothetical protein
LLREKFLMHFFIPVLLFLALTWSFGDTSVRDTSYIVDQKKCVFEDVTYIPLDIEKSCHMVWSLCLNPDGIIMVGASNHLDNSVIYTFDTKTSRLTLQGDLMRLGRLHRTDWQSKMHSYIFWNKKTQEFVFGTDAGTYRSETIVEHPYGYRGGHWFAFNPITRTLRDYGLVSPHRSVKSAAYSEAHQMLYCTTDPQEHLVSYSIETGKIKDYGRINGFHQPRHIFCDKWGNAYTSDIHGDLVKLDREKQSLVELRIKLPRADQLKFWHRAGSIVAVQEMEDGSVYGLTHWGIAFKYVPVRKGPGRITDLGPVYGRDSGKVPHLYAPNIAVLGNKMYYALGGHGSYVDTAKREILLMEKDLKTKKNRIIHRFNKSKATEYRGSGIIDKQGNVWFGAHSHFFSGSDVETIAEKELLKDRIGYLVKFNPKVLADKLPEKNKK